ncbi:MAG: hypothetical protein J4G04_07650, partial [Nitrosopumilaceae archaeon]|nr:hypothetical protein [Nitrosopumilaceae archaeon]
PPGESGFVRGSWNSTMVARRILERFGIICGRRTALGAAHRLGFSVRKPWPIPYNSATPEEQVGFIERTRGTIARWKGEGRTVPAIDAATLRDSPVSRRGLRRRGGRDTVRTNHSKKAMRLVGAPGDGTLDLQFHEDLKAGSHVDLVECARRRHKKIGIIIPQRRRPHRQGHTGLHLRYEWNRRDGAHPAPHPAAQPYGAS